MSLSFIKQIVGLRNKQAMNIRWNKNQPLGAPVCWQTVSDGIFEDGVKWTGGS